MQLDGYQELVVMKNGKQLLNGYGVSFGGDKNVLKLDGDGDYTAF